jgi:hypothetical protein
LIKDYDLGINYHSRKANVVADALSHKKYCNATFTRRMQPELRRKIAGMDPHSMAQYVVEFSLGIPTGCVEKLRWQIAGMFGEATMAEPYNGVGKAAMAGTHKAQEGASGWV